MPVRHRAIENLPDRKADQIGGNGELHLRGRGVELVRDIGQRRQVHVGRQRTDRAQRREQGRERESAGAQHDAIGSAEYRAELEVAP